MRLRRYDLRLAQIKRLRPSDETRVQIAVYSILVAAATLQP